MITVITPDYGNDYGFKLLNSEDYYAYYGKTPSRVCARSRNMPTRHVRTSRAYIHTVITVITVIMKRYQAVKP